MGEVWLARRDDGALRRDVALKLPLLDPARRDVAVRFARERDILAGLEHPNIARLYDAGVAQGQPFLAMERVHGRHITTYCDARRLDIEGRRHATATEKRPEAWLMRVEANGHGVVTDDLLNREERADEFLLMGLRLTEGIDPRRYAALSGRMLDERRIAVLREEGAITVDADGRLRVTQAGFPVLDAVVADLAA